MSTIEQSVHRGRCLCGSVRFHALGDPVIVAHCHCEDCQRLTGAGHSTGAMFPAARFELGGDFREYELISDAGNTVTRVFCPRCGSPILGRNTAMPGFVTVSLGVLDDSSGFVPSVAIFARNRKPWDAMDGTVATFDAQPEWHPGDGKGSV
jgi:hypothetical protein